MSRSLHVVCQIHGFPPHSNAGAEWMMAPMLSALAERGHRVEVHLTYPAALYPDPWELGGVRVLPPDPGRSSLRPDVYVTHLQNNRPAAARARGLGVPLVMVMHNTRSDRRDLPQADPALTVFNSTWMKEHIGWGGPSIVVRPPVLARDYQTQPGDSVTLVNLTETKGGSLFWQAAAAMPGTSFLAVQGSYGDQIIPDPVPANVTVLGCMDGRLMRDQVYARTRILLVPSDYESWGRVATEAMCSGIPVIAHRAEGGLAENLGDAAIWASRDDPGEWVRQIQRLSRAAIWRKASLACAKRYGELEPEKELAAWCDAVEALVP